MEAQYINLRKRGMVVVDVGVWGMEHPTSSFPLPASTATIEVPLQNA